MCQMDDIFTLCKQIFIEGFGMERMQLHFYKVVEETT
jgi:hypothetical protein